MLVVQDFYRLTQIAVDLYENLQTKYGQFTIELEQVEPLQLSIQDESGYRVANLREEVETSPFFPETRRTHIDDETTWATQLLSGLAWVLLPMRQEGDDDIIYD